MEMNDAISMTDQERAAEFMDMNDRFLIVGGEAKEPNPFKPGNGASFLFQNGRTLVLTQPQIRLLPKGYPKWAGS